MESYIWKITDKALITQIKTAKPGQPFNSPSFRLFNLTFQLELFPNGHNDDREGTVTIFLNICGLSPKVHSVNMMRKYTLAELNVAYQYNETVTHEQMYCGSWPKGYVKTADIQKLHEMTFKVDITLFNVFDKDGEDITDKYLKNVEHKTEIVASTEDQQLNSAKLDSVIMQIEKLNQSAKAMQRDINDLKLRMEEEEKNANDDRIDKLEQTVNKLSLLINSNININPEQQKLKFWFENKVKLPEYYDLFIENGIEDLSTVSLLTMDSIKSMGVDKIGHQIKLLHQIDALKGINDNNNNNKVANEGGPTAYI